MTHMNRPSKYMGDQHAGALRVVGRGGGMRKGGNDGIPTHTPLELAFEAAHR